VVENVIAAPCVTTIDCGWLATSPTGACFTCNTENEVNCDNY
jgi:hypothetical protein